MSESEAPALLDVADGIATITLNRPQVLNALDRTLSTALTAIFDKVSADPAVRVVVIRGAGDAFMAGGDIQFFNRKLKEGLAPEALGEAIAELVKAGQALALAVKRIPKPVIASIHGGCAGWGVSLMLGCDLAIAADNAKFTLAFINLGTTPDGGATYYLPRVVGQKRAAEIAMLSDRFGAAEAERWGLINRVVPLSELQEATMKMAARLARGPGAAYARTKALLQASSGHSLDEQLDAETGSFAACAMTADFAEGVSAFLEKRPPSFTGK